MGSSMLDSIVQLTSLGCTSEPPPLRCGVASKLDSRFGELLTHFLEARKRDDRSFARQVGYDNSLIGKVKRGTRRPPANDLIKWADALTLDGSDRDDFLEAGLLLHTPPWIRQRYIAARDATHQRPRR